MAQANGHVPSRPLKAGVYVPTITFFDPDTEDLDLATIKKHAVRLAEAGVAGLTVQGSNGEAVHMSNQERITVTKATREALDEAGFVDMPLIIGAGAQSTREAIIFAKEAAQAGGDYTLVLPPSYYKAMVPRKDLLDYFRDIASGSPIPLLIYNYPGVVNGIDLSAEDIIELSKHPKIVGCKLTCANVGKLQRITKQVESITHLSGAGSPGFMAMGGMADITIPVMMGGGSGVITGLGNVTPKACVKVFNLFAEGKVEEAKKAQAIVAQGDWGAIAGGIPGTKSALQTFYGYGGYGRKPLPKPTSEEEKKYADLFRECVEYENSL
ncbi:putative dihydrodipicolinate synthetase [Phaeomoniella chlamydospora]|uniref:Putative dihydrodipicolinate synthetase n=1 Tax=Phaeomoniella chlamydospora TaxID=158046 RepID=A0A0G2EFP8_PHACM|nr:putative dihydrodipicolinate synthetase [Phaeomoniella chlamydospora]